MIKNFPCSSGVYLMKDAGGKIIYVGKAVDLKKRVQSYFRKRRTGTKTDLLVSEISDIDYILTESEAEALLLEASLIKKHHPKYNISLRDDKTYPYIEVTAEEFPRIAVVRPGERTRNSIYYGPYTNPKMIREALGIIRRIFPFRVCDPLPKRACLDYHIGLCEAPCEGHQSRREYQKNIRNVKLILEGKKEQLYKQLTREMERFSRMKAFEQAARIRDQLRAIGALYSGTRDVNYFKETEQLQRVLRLPRRPQRIETFDISNMMGKESVGSMVSFFNGRPDKQNYRRFKIKTVQRIDDTAMIAEVVCRRYSRLKREARLLPDLILIDGGKGQLNAAHGQVRSLDLFIPVVSLAKREEEVFVPGRARPVVLPKNSLALQLLQRCRDEAHRFALRYHRQLRGKAALDA